MLDVFSMLYCPYCEPDQTLQLLPIIQSQTEQGMRINQGIIFCIRCYRYYIIKDEITFLSQDHLRDRKDELLFLRTSWPGLEEKLKSFLNNLLNNTQKKRVVFKNFKIEIVDLNNKADVNEIDFLI